MKRRLLGAIAAGLAIGGLSGYWAPSAQAACTPGSYSVACFAGSYGFSFNGTVIKLPPTPPTLQCSGWTPVSIPVAGSGILTGDGKGGLTGVQTFNAGGLVCTGTLMGTYTINPDGTGRLMNVIFTPDNPDICSPSAGNTSLALSNGTSRLDLTGTDCFQVTSGTATKQ